MELRQRKLIHNLPKYEPGKEATEAVSEKGGFGIPSPFAIIGSGLSFAQQLYNSPQLGFDQNDIYMSGNNSQNYYNGYGYNTRQIDRRTWDGQIDAQKTSNTVGSIGSGVQFGAQVGSFLGPVGAVGGGLLGGLIGGISSIFGNDELQEKYEVQLLEAQRKAGVDNLVGKSNAATMYDQDQFNSKYESNKPQILYAANGKDAHTAFGKINGGMYNAKVGGSEIMGNTQQEQAHVIDGEFTGDNKNALVNDSDYILSAKMLDDNALYPFFPHLQYARNAANILEQKNSENKHNKLRGNLGKSTDKFNKNVAQQVLNSSQETQAQLREVGYFGDDDNNNVLHAKNGKDVPKFAFGWDNLLSSGLGAITGLSQYFGAKSQSIKAPNSYVANQYMYPALNKLSGLKIDYQPIINNLRERGTNMLNSLYNTGGLSTKDRLLSRMAVNRNTQDAIANAIMAGQEKNNAYISDYASKMLSAGEAERQAKFNANAYDLDYYSKAHAAKQQQMQMGMRNFVDSIQQGVANQFKLNQFEDTMDLYRQKVALDREKLAWEMGKGNSNTSVSTSALSYQPWSQGFELNDFFKSTKPSLSQIKPANVFSQPTPNFVQQFGTYMPYSIWKIGR